MKRRQRQRQILDLLAAEPELEVADACRMLQASEATIRREFAQLARAGRVEKTWGGIRQISAPRVELLAPPAFARRLDEDAAEKKAIAAAAAEILRDGDVVMIDGGTTTYQLAGFIAGKRIRIITNSIAIAHAIDQLRAGRRGAEIYLTGGILQPESGVLAGPPAEAFLKRYRADWAFLSAAGVDEKAVTNYDEAVLASERLMIERSTRVVVLADHTKLGRQAMCSVCPVSKVNHLFTGDVPASETLTRRLKRAGVTVARINIR